MNIALVDDMQAERDAVSAILRQYASVNGLDLRVDCFSRGEDLLQDYRPFRYTVIFLDIYMDGMTGTETARRLRETDGDALLIFLTSSGEHMPDAFRVHAYDYVRKPPEASRIFQIMDDILSRHTSAGSMLTFPSGRTEYSIPYGSIAAVCSAGHYLDITDQNGASYRTRMTFSSVRDALARDGRFLLISRGILVNMEHILGFSDGVCRLRGSLSLPYNLRNRRQIEQTWQNYVFRTIRKEAMERGRQP